MKRIVAHTVERVLVDDEHPSDGRLAKLADTRAYVEPCDKTLELLAAAAALGERGRLLGLPRA